MEFEYYENLSYWESAFNWGNPDEKKRLCRAAELLPSPIRSLLDAGCGNGAFLALLEAQGAGCQLFGLERSCVARRMAICSSPIFAASIDKIPIADQNVQTVTALEVIEHLPYGVYENALDEIQRVAREYILISVPYKEQRNKAFCPYCGCAFNPSFHLRTFSPQILMNLFPFFTLINQSIVSIREYCLSPLIQKLYLRYLRRWEDTFICPQCHYRRVSEGGSSSNFRPKARTSLAIREIFKKLFPRSSRPKWIITLYKRIR